MSSPIKPQNKLHKNTITITITITIITALTKKFPSIHNITSTDNPQPHKTVNN